MTRFSEAARKRAHDRIRQALAYRASAVSRGAASGVYRTPAVVTTVNRLASDIFATYLPGLDEDFVTAARVADRHRLATGLVGGSVGPADVFEILEVEREVAEARVLYDQYSFLLVRSGTPEVADRVLSHAILASIDPGAYDVSIKVEFPTGAFGEYGAEYPSLMQGIRQGLWERFNRVDCQELLPFTLRGLISNIRLTEAFVSARQNAGKYSDADDRSQDLVSRQHQYLATAAGVYAAAVAGRLKPAVPFSFRPDLSLG
jgi:hypothetical protein